MPIVKRCQNPFCDVYFPSELGIWMPYCPACFEEKKESLTNKIKRMRMIPVEYFDVWDTNFNYKGCKSLYERVCRVCGARLLTKKGIHSPAMRHCKKHTGSFLSAEWNWSFIRGSFIMEHLARHRIEIECRKIDEFGFNPYLSFYVKCEICEGIIHHNDCEVHHIIPVHTLTYETLDKIWDRKNLIVLCKKCHNKQDHQLKISDAEKKRRKKEFTEMINKGNKKITNFF